MFDYHRFDGAETRGFTRTSRPCCCISYIFFDKNHKLTARSTLPLAKGKDVSVGRVSSISAEKATQKYHKIHRSRLFISKKREKTTTESASLPATKVADFCAFNSIRVFENIQAALSECFLLFSRL